MTKTHKQQVVSKMRKSFIRKGLKQISNGQSLIVNGTQNLVILKDIYVLSLFNIPTGFSMSILTELLYAALVYKIECYNP